MIYLILGIVGTVIQVGVTMLVWSYGVGAFFDITPLTMWQMFFIGILIRVSDTVVEKLLGTE